ncbi:adenine deaminase [bacterium]|nr:adenine deaminase [bacterium]
MNIEELTSLIEVAKGAKPADLVLRGAQIVNTLSGEVYPTDVAIFGDKIAGIGDYEGREVVELGGGYLVPGLIDGHCHIESSMVAPGQYAAGVLPLGTTAVFADPHEIANVMGIEGIKLMIRLAEGLPLSVYFMASSCVPATNMETSGADIEASDIAALFDEKSVVGLAEMMNYPGVIFCVPKVLEKLIISNGRVIDGHAPGLSGKSLEAYIAAGIGSEHEATTPEEALEKLRAGMSIMIREGTGERNLDALLPMITPANSRRIMFASDDLHPPEILGRGHIDYMIRRAIEFGIDPIDAIRMATLNAAEYFRKFELGAIAPGKRANLLWVEDLSDFRPAKVWAKGSLVAENGELIDDSFANAAISPPKTMNPAPFDENSFAIPASDGAEMHIIGLIPEQIVTEHLIEKAKIVDGHAVADSERDILKMAVIERHKATGNIGLGFVKGFGIKRGAIASSVGHDSHNLIVAGSNDADMAAAARAVADMGGGFAAVANGDLLGSLPLPLAGLMSLETIGKVNEQLASIKKITAQMGSTIEDPFMLLGFLALPVIPKLKLTDKGLVDVERFKIINLFA